MEMCETSGLPIPMISHLHQSSGYIRRKLRVRGSPKCKALFGAEIVLISVGLQSTPFYYGKFRAKNGNMQNFGLTNPHGTAFAPKHW